MSSVRIVASDPLADSTTNHSFTEKSGKLFPPIGAGQDEQSPLLKQPEDLKEKWKGKRWKVLILITAFAFLSPLTNSTYSPSLTDVQDHYHADKTLMSYTQASYSLGMAVLPLLWGPLSDRLSRKYVIFGTQLLYSAASLFLTFAPNIWAVIVGRGIQAAGLASLITVGSASISDVYPFMELGKAMGIFGAAPGIMPVVSPILGGFLTDEFGFKYLFAGMSGLGVLAALLTFFLLPETLDKEAGVKRSFNLIRPLRLLLHPSIGIVVLATSLNYGGSSLMLFQFSIDELAGLPTWKRGCFLAGYGVGTILGNLSSGKLSDVTRRKLGAKGYLMLVVIGCVGYACSIFAFGHWIKTSVYVAVVCTFLVGYFITFTYPPALVFAMEQQPKNPSAVAAAFQISYLPSTMVCFALGPHLLDKYGVDRCFMAAGCLILLLSFPMMGMLVYFAVKDRRKRLAIQENSNSGGSGESNVA